MKLIFLVCCKEQLRAVEKRVNIADSWSNRKISWKEKTAEATDTGRSQRRGRSTTGVNLSPQGYISQWKDIICVIQKEMKMVVKTPRKLLRNLTAHIEYSILQGRRFKERGGEGPRWLVDTF